MTDEVRAIELTMQSGDKRKFLRPSIWSYGALAEPIRAMTHSHCDDATGEVTYDRTVTVNSYICCAAPQAINVAETVEQLAALLGW
jgi:hypothetical protein